MINLALILLMTTPSVEWTALPSGGMVDVECAGDLNGDGTDDLFAASVEGYTGVFCLDGLTGDVIWWNDHVTGVYGTGCMRTIDDIDTDGYYDLVLGTSSPPAIRTLSGLTGNVVWDCPQTYPVHYVEQARNISSNEVAILVSVDLNYENHIFYALNGHSGAPIWSTGVISTLDEWIRITESDVSGNGWSEMGYSVDRSSVMNGGAVARDGYTGQTLCTQSTCYFGTMDICSGLYPCLAVSSFGWNPVMLVKSLTTGSVVWESDDEDLFYQNLDFISNITGIYTPYREILGWYGNELLLIRGDDGFYEDTYEFPNSIRMVDCYIDEDEQWRLAALTSSTFYCPYLVFSSPSVEPSVTLPGNAGYDMCFLRSDAYATPLVAVAMRGTSAPGICVLSTSTSLAISPESGSSFNQFSQVRLLSNPCWIGITLIGEEDGDILVTDITGRVIDVFSITRGEQVFKPLPVGVYMILDHNSGMLLHRAVVL